MALDYRADAIGAHAVLGDVAGQNRAEIPGWLRAVDENVVTDSRLVVRCISSAQMAAVVHPVVQDANHQHAGVVALEERAVSATRGHLQAR